MKALKQKAKNQAKEKSAYHIKEEDDLLTAATSIDRYSLTVLVPRELLVMQGGQQYDDTHPFVQALRFGASELKSFYATQAPKTLCEFYGLINDTRLGADLPPWEIPWHERSERKPPPGEHGLSREHGVSFYGPVSDEKLALEMERLKSTLASIQREGFLPEEYGHIEGHALHAGRDVGVRFFVKGGKHRAAVLSFLGYDLVPVRFRPRYQRVVDINQSRAWPLVKRKVIDESLAREVFLAYF